MHIDKQISAHGPDPRSWRLSFWEDKLGCTPCSVQMICTRHSRQALLSEQVVMRLSDYQGTKLAAHGTLVICQYVPLAPSGSLIRHTSIPV